MKNETHREEVNESQHQECRADEKEVSNMSVE